MRNVRYQVGVAVALGALLFGVGVAHAQPGAPPPPPPGGGYGPPPAPAFGAVDRHGFIVGFSIGGGSMVPDCDGCDSESGVAVDLHLGGMLNPRFALMWDGSGVAHTEENLTLISAVNTVAAQYWATPQLWVKGGLGFGQLSISSDGDTLAESDTAAAVMGAVGFEVMQTRTFALDLSFRFATVAYDELNLTNVALNVGFNWY